MKEFDCFLDKKGSIVSQDDALFDGETYWRMNYDDGSQYSETYLLSCTQGYMHDLTQDSFNNMERIGTFDENKDKFVCD